MPLHPTPALILSVAVAFASFVSPLSAQPSNGITREVFTGIAGDIPSLTNNVNFPNNPALAEVLTTSMDCPQNWADNYGTRLRAIITAPTTGNYVFWIASDDNSVLYLSTDANPANKRQIASVTTWTGWREWTKEANQQSTNIALVGGQQYYLEALQAEGGGGDNLTVRWQLPSLAIEEPIPATRCTPVGVTAPIFTLQPTNVTVVEGNQINFAVSITHSFSATLQWQRANTDLPGQTATNLLVGPVSLADSGSVFRCVAMNFAGTSFTTNAVLRVVPDTTAPTISSVGNLGDNQIVSVVFSEPVEAASATLAANYTINGITVLGAQFGPDNRTIILSTTPMAANVTYTLTVNNVRDLASTPNTIAPNTQRTFSLTTRPIDISFLKPGTEIPGPSTRRGPFVISEVMYHPTNRYDARNIEFIEVFNSNPWFEEMGGFRISGAIDYTFPSNFVLQARSYVVVAAVPADVQAVYGISGVLGPWTGSLQNGDGTLRIRNARDAILFEMSYSGDPPFPASADGAGHSLVLARPSYGEGDPRAWSASDVIGGTPGTNEVATLNVFRNVMINEFLAHSVAPDLDYIELFNYSSGVINVGNCALTDDPSTNKFVIPAGTIIPANGFAVFYETNMGFSLSSGGETIYFKNPQNSRVLDAVRFEDQEQGVATGRSPDGGQNFYRLQSQTPGTNNARIRPPQVVINEIMYDPVTDDSNDEFVELYNPGTNAIEVSKWRLEDGVKFTIPNNTFIPGNGYLVIAANAVHLRANYTNLTAFNCLGDWSGSLKNSGERIALSTPEQIISNNGGVLVTNTHHVVVDEVTYRDGGRWGKWSGGGGSSLELRDWRSDHRLSPNWADSDESAKSPWVNVEVTGVMDNGYENATQLHITLMGPGEVLIDNLEMYSPQYGNTNLIGNNTFETDASNWVFQGNHNQTSWEPGEGYLSSRSLHLRAVGRGDTGANRVRTQLPFTLASGSTVTMRAKVRWLKGNPNILLRMRGNYLEAPGFVLSAKNLGTPGTRNSTATTNAGPAITDVAHFPVMPAANAPVLVTARASDSDGIATILLSYRIDPTTNFITLAMTNNGAGIYSTVIPGQISGALAAFYIQAADKIAPNVSTKFPNDAPLRECLVRWGEPAAPGNNTLGTYRMWITQANADKWTAEEKMSNNPKDVTFIYGTNRIVYNAGAWFHGSPYHSPSYNSPLGNGCDYDMGFPSDDKLLGETDINLFRPGNGGGDGTGQGEIHAYWFGGQFGLPFLYHRPVFVYMNGTLRNPVYHDAQQPNGDFASQWYPDDPDGELHKVQLGFEFGDTAYGSGEPGYTAVGANFARYTTTGGAFKMARYRQILPLRSASPSEQNDYTNLYSLVNATLTGAAINTDPYTITLTNYFDVREWFKVHVAQHLWNNSDSFSYGGGQNAFIYKPQHDTWKIFLWDVDFAFGGSSTDPNLFSIGGNDHGPRNDHAPFTRIYWQALIEAANTFMTAARSNPILDARYNGMVAAGASLSSPSGIETFISQRRDYVLSQIAANNTSPFEIQFNGGADFSTSNNLVTLTGRAPFEVATIEVNGIAYNVTWTTLTNWSLRVALPAGTNALTVIGYDQYHNAVSNASDTIAVTVVGPPAPPQNFIVINEIMFNPRVPNAEYVELFNTSSNFSFDISGWRVDGISYTFPDGTLMQPRSFILLVKDLMAFAAAYGTNVVPFGVYDGNLKSEGETLTLIKPGLTASNDVVIDEVRYENIPGWSTNANATGSSFQLIDAKQDNSRPGNWFSLYSVAVYTNEVSTPAHTNDGWRFVGLTGNIGNGEGNGAFRLLAYLGEPGSALVDDFSLVAGTTAGVGQNFVRNGDFESPLDTVPVTNSWIIGTNCYGNSFIDSSLVHAGSGSFKIVGTNSAGAANAPTYNKCIYQFLSPAPTASTTHTLSFWFWATNSATNLYVRIRNSTALSTGPFSGPTNINITISPSNYVPGMLISPGTNTLTPGAPNIGTNALVAFPTLWLNEVQADNLSGILDSAGQHDPWVEIFNSGTNAVVLTNLYLSGNYSNLTQWAFPTNVTIGATQFLVVFCDGQTNQTTNNELHTNFRLTSGAGSVVLSRISNNQTQVMDYLNYVASTDHSYGSFPDGQPFTRQEFYFVTPGATNDGTLPPVIVSINEWMADNGGTLADPSDNDFEDWFELYNPDNSTVSLAGYFLTDTLTNKFKFQIPAGYSIPPHGYLLVWADNETVQNSPAVPDLHVNFSLAKSGEALGLFTPSGIAIDTVTFGAQTTDVSMGRFPDGSGNIQFMTNYTPRAANFIPQPNTAPTLAPIPNKIVVENQSLFFTATATDSNVPAQQLTWSLLPGAPGTASIGATNGVFSWMPGELDGGNTFPISVRVVDNGSPPLSATQSFNVTVTKTNSAPTLTPLSDKFVNEGALLTFNATASDSDVPAQQLTFSLDTNNLPAGAAITTNGVFSWTPNEAQGPGVYNVRVRVTDNGTPPMNNSQVVAIHVDEVNQPPVLASITNLTAAIGETVSFTAHATDADLPPQLITFDFAGNVPAGATIGATNGVFSWTANSVGTNTFSIRATDNGVPALSDTKTFSVVVTASLTTSIAVSNNIVTLNWNAISNRAYNVEYKNDLSENSWSPLATNIVASGTSATLNDPVGTNQQRIYRIVQQP